MSARSAFRKSPAWLASAASATAATCASRTARCKRQLRPVRSIRVATKATGGCAAGARSSQRRAVRSAAPDGGASADGLTPGEGMRECAAVYVLELPAHRHAVRDAAGAHGAPRGELTQVMRGRLALHRRVGCEDQLAHLTLGEYRLELTHTEL